MHGRHSVSALRLTLQYTKSSTMPADHKALLMGLLTDALRDQHALDANAAARDSAAKPWEAAETAVLQSFLAGKVATSWQHADEVLLVLASKLGREPQYVRSRATDFGYGAGVDYRIARVLIADRARAELEADSHFDSANPPHASQR